MAQTRLPPVSPMRDYVKITLRGIEAEGRCALPALMIGAILASFLIGGMLFTGNVALRPIVAASAIILLLR